jgi:hypothetical protein
VTPGQEHYKSMLVVKIEPKEVISKKKEFGVCVLNLVSINVVLLI